MKNNKFKIISLIMCFVIAFCAGLHGMEENFEKDEGSRPKVSWGSYLISPLKNAIKITNDAMIYGINNPTKSLIIGLSMACRTVNASIEYYDCLCKMKINQKSSIIKEAAFLYTTNYTNLAVCEMECHLLCLETTVLSGRFIMNPNASECFVGAIIF